MSDLLPDEIWVNFQQWYPEKGGLPDGNKYVRADILRNKMSNIYENLTGVLQIFDLKNITIDEVPVEKIPAIRTIIAAIRNDIVTTKAPSDYPQPELHTVNYALKISDLEQALGEAQFALKVEQSHSETLVNAVKLLRKNLIVISTVCKTSLHEEPFKPIEYYQEIIKGAAQQAMDALAQTAHLVGE